MPACGSRWKLQQLRQSDADVRQSIRETLVQIYGTMLVYHRIDSWKQQEGTLSQYASIQGNEFENVFFDVNEIKQWVLWTDGPLDYMS